VDASQYITEQRSNSDDSDNSSHSDGYRDLETLQERAIREGLSPEEYQQRRLYRSAESRGQNPQEFLYEQSRILQARVQDGDTEAIIQMETLRSRAAEGDEIAQGYLGSDEEDSDPEQTSMQQRQEPHSQRERQQREQSNLQDRSSDSSNSESEMSQEQREQRRDLLRRARAGNTEARDQLQQEQRQAIEQAAAQQGMTVQEYQRHYQRQAIERAAAQQGMTIQEYQQHRQRQAIDRRDLTPTTQHSEQHQEQQNSNRNRLQPASEQYLETTEQLSQHLRNLFLDSYRNVTPRQQHILDSAMEVSTEMTQELSIQTVGFGDPRSLMLGDILQGGTRVSTGLDAGVTENERQSDLYQGLKESFLTRLKDKITHENILGQRQDTERQNPEPRQGMSDGSHRNPIVIDSDSDDESQGNSEVRPSWEDLQQRARELQQAAERQNAETRELQQATERQREASQELNSSHENPIVIDSDDESQENSERRPS
jgi:hypothetical protein